MIWSDFVQVSCSQVKPHRPVEAQAGFNPLCLSQIPACASKVQTGLYLCVCHINALSGQNLTDTRVCLHALARPSRTSTVVRGSGGLRPDLAVHLH